jgi:peptidase E
MKEQTHNKLIFLSGGGDENQSLPFDEFFLEKIPENGNILYIPIALKKHSLFKNSEKWMKNLLAMHERSDISLQIVKDEATLKNIDPNLYSGIYVGGGNTYKICPSSITVPLISQYNAHSTPVLAA